MGNTASVDSLNAAIERGDLKAVRRRASKMSRRQLNAADSDGRSPLQVASCADHEEIFATLVDSGASPFNIQQTSGDRKFAAAFQEWFDRIRKEEPDEWEFGDKKAVVWADAVDRGCAKYRTIQKTVNKIRKDLFHDIPWPERKADLIPIDDFPQEPSESNRLSALALAIRYLQEAAFEDDPTYLIRAYTLESPFYTLVNRYLCLGGSHDAVKKFRRRWGGYFVGSILHHPKLQEYRFLGGFTYRGINILEEKFSKYEVGMAMATKTFQSSSRKPGVAQGFLKLEHFDEEGRLVIPVFVTCRLVDHLAGLKIRKISRYPDEEEVLILPGTLFYVVSIDATARPRRVCLQQQSLLNRSGAFVPPPPPPDSDDEDPPSTEPPKPIPGLIRRETEEPVENPLNSR